ncbi:MAG: YgiQ family radical SAM protein [Candidatus Aminicenantes bacterium]|nr:YgiQ family radical SAM protein [Candidatus Aminicenantes bacterium]
MKEPRPPDYDVVLITGEPHVDHPLSASGMISRVLEEAGFSVGIIEHPDWKGDADFLRAGAPRLYFGITAGSVDSLLVNLTPLKRRRETDIHAPYRSAMPDRAVLVYANKVRSLFPGVPIVIGGIEASLRRFAHYDYWENRVRRSLLLDSRADILVYGPGEYQAVEIARRLAEGRDLQGIAGTCIVRKERPELFIEIPSAESVTASPEAFAEAQMRMTVRSPLAQGHDARFVLQYPAPRVTPSDLDRIYALPFSRMIPAGFPEFRMAQFSVVTHRGCFGHCSFCALALHQGEGIVSRSEDSIQEEIRRLVRHPEFKGYIDDLGGPTANMYGMDCETVCGKPCLDCAKRPSHDRLIALLRRARAVPGVKKVFVRSGVRFDLALESGEYIRELVGHHVSGFLKIAPEHVSKHVLRLMNKDGGVAFERFRKAFRAADPAGRQKIKSYFMVAHPGCGPGEARELAREVRRLEKDGDRPVEGVQIFTPTPMTLSTAMYHTGLDPRTGEPVYVPRTFQEVKEQKRMLLSARPGRPKRR